MNIRDMLSQAAAGSDVTKTNMFDFEYTEQTNHCGW